MIKNKKMKSIQLVNACNKLKVFKDKLSDEIDIKIKKIKDKYRRNKLMAIEHTKCMIHDDKYFLDFFESHKKKDDLADAYLMCKYLVNKINI